MTSFGHALDELMKRRGFSPQRLARLLGTRAETISDFQKDPDFPCSQWVKLFVADLGAVMQLTALERSKLLIAVQEDRRAHNGQAAQVETG